MAWYEYPYNYSNGSSVEGVGSFMQYVGQTSNGAAGLGILVGAFLLSFLAVMSFGIAKALATASFITLMISIYLFRLGMINLSIIFFIGTAFVVFVIASLFEK